MKSKELIKQLLKNDPSGDLDVGVGGIDISFVSLEPSYYDGYQQVIIRNDEGIPISGKYAYPNKIKLHTLSFQEILWDRPEFIIDYSHLSPERAKRYKELHDRHRKAGIDCLKNIEKEYFTEFLIDKALQISDERYNISDAINNFLNVYDSTKPLPPDLEAKKDLSYIELRKIQWNREVNLKLDIDNEVWLISEI